MSRHKIAVFTMDMELFSDTGCIHESGVEVRQTMLDGLDEYMALLEKHHVPATLFAMCEAAETVKDKIASYLQKGHSLALHGEEHTAPMLMDDEEFRRRTAEAKKRLETLFGVEVRGYRAPFFSLDNRRLDILTELGFRYDSSRFDFPKRDHATHIDISDFSKLTENVFCRNGFYEFGMPCERWCGLRIPVSGGGYIRIGDWGFFSSILHHYLQKSDYYVFYLHPFELSRERVPYIPHLKKRDQVYLRMGTRTFGIKIELIIRMLKRLGYEFVTFDQLADYLESNDTMFQKI